jgi:hypothetical protein
MELVGTQVKLQTSLCRHREVVRVVAAIKQGDLCQSNRKRPS